MPFSMRLIREIVVLMRPLLAIAVFMALPAHSLGASEAAPRTRQFIDFSDPTYGGRVRQIFNPAGDEHNLYHYRSVFNADNSRFVGIEQPKGTTDYRVTLYDGDGQYLKHLFTQAEYDWTLAWDRRDPRYLYTGKSGTIYRYDVDAGKAQALRTFAKPSVAGPSGLSLNQQGDRLLVRMTDNSVRNFRLPALDDERISRIEVPEGWVANWDKLRFIGHQDYFALTLEPKHPAPVGMPRLRAKTRIYDGATGEVFYTHDDTVVGHHDFSRDGLFAYVDFPFNQKQGMTVRTVKLDGTDSRVVFSAPIEKLRHVRNYHITWPAGISDWFLLSFFPQTGRLPRDYQSYLDEIIQVFTDGRTKVIARTGTTCAENFWAQPQQSISADGTRVLFNTNGTCTVGHIGEKASGTIDQCILYLK